MKFKNDEEFWLSDIAWATGGLELFHAREIEDPSSVAVLVTVSSFEAMDEFMKFALYLM